MEAPTSIPQAATKRKEPPTDESARKIKKPRRLDYVKCSFCRHLKQKCERDGNWPQKCRACIKTGKICSEDTTTQGVVKLRASAVPVTLLERIQSLQKQCDRLDCHLEKVQNVSQIEDEYRFYNLVEKKIWIAKKDALGENQIRVLKSIHEMHEEVKDHQNVTEKYLFSELLAPLLRRAMAPGINGSVGPPWIHDKTIVQSITEQIDFLTQSGSHRSALDMQEVLVSSLAISYTGRELQEHVDKLVRLNAKHKLNASGLEDTATNSDSKQFVPLLLRSLHNARVVEGIIATGTESPGQTDHLKRTALHLVLEQGAVPLSHWGSLQTEMEPWKSSETLLVAKILLDWGVPVHPVDTFQRNVLHIACWQAVDYRIIQRLLEHPYFKDSTSIDLKDSTGRTPFAWAVLTGQFHVAKLLLSTGMVDVNTKDDLGMNPLCVAAETGRADILRLLLDAHGIQVIAHDEEEMGWTPLQVAFDEQHEEVMELLVRRRDVNVNIIQYSDDEENQTPLIWAVREGRRELVRLLLNRVDIEMDMRFEGRTAREWAVVGGRQDVLDWFAERGRGCWNV
ncbi:hypothetical protein BLS_009821 [Venturia inaequalis]|uniref:Zn(2)-C6 fungal-type domain-containing protein n=1 Tax=Venturia inaequalis TaxID=5025 RepID=A0A8H3U3Y8_VENIN|nr:hypothetical protein BLS_009821 [Venturia inaequalis]